MKKKCKSSVLSLTKRLEAVARLPTTIIFQNSDKSDPASLFIAVDGVRAGCGLFPPLVSQSQCGLFELFRFRRRRRRRSPELRFGSYLFLLKNVCQLVSEILSLSLGDMFGGSLGFIQSSRRNLNKHVFINVG